MPLPAAKPLFDTTAYLTWEAEQPGKHEYLDGEVFAMAGASEAHVNLAGNIYIALRNHLRGSPCSVFISGMKLQVEADNAFFYPDIFVTCAESDHAHSHYKAAPSLVVEVLSPTTSAYDRGAKFAVYRKLPSLREYALVDTERHSIDLFRRDDSGHWVLYPYEAGHTVEFASVGLSLTMEQLYEDAEIGGGPARPSPGAGFSLLK